MATVMAVSLIASALAASAASLGGINEAELFVWSANVSISTASVFDEFDSCSGDLHGATDSSGNAWHAPSGAWLCHPAHSHASNDSVASIDSATIDAGSSDGLIVSTFLSRTSQNGRDRASGLALFLDPATGFHMYVVYQRSTGEVIVGKVDASGNTQLAQWSYATNLNYVQLEVVITQPILEVAVDGTPLGTYDMTQEQAGLGANTHFGLESHGDRRSWWDWFKVEAS